LTTGLDPTNSSSGSASNKIIYTVVRPNSAAYSTLSGVADGCKWHIEFENGTFVDLDVPLNYTGTEDCYYNSTCQIIANNNDAMQVSVNKLLGLLDFDGDGIVDVVFNSQDLSITSSSITGIPYSWSTEMGVRTWS